jgi:hypothetical protein
MNDETTDLITDNLLPLGSAPGAAVWLNASRISRRNGTMLYHLEVHYESATGWLNIDPGSSLTVTVDGQDYHYTGLGSTNMRKKGAEGRFVEDAIYQVTSIDLRRIASAHEVKVRALGAQGAVQRDFAPANIEKFKAFVSRYMDRTS